MVKNPNNFVKYYLLEEKLDLERQERIAKERGILEKIKKMMSVSTQINLEIMRVALNLDKKEFNNKIFDWASEFGFTIDGDYLFIKKETISDFIDKLDKQFDIWGNEEDQVKKRYSDTKS